MSDNEEEFQDTPNNQNQGGKRNRKNKKGKGGAAAAQDTAEQDAAMEAEAAKRREQEAAMLAAGGDGAGSDDDEDDPIFGKKKKGKNNKKGAQAAQNEDGRRQRGGGKKGRKGQQQEVVEDEQAAADEGGNQEEEEEKKEPAVTAEAETATAAVKPTYPLQVVYCGVSGLPPEYNEWAARGTDLDACKKWLAENHEDLFNELYAVAEGEEETKQSGKSKGKKVKKVGFASDAEKKIRVIKLKRGGKKTVSSIVGMDAYGCDLADCAKILSRKLGSGAAAMEVEYQELKCQGIQVQGDVTGKLELIFENELVQYNIPVEKIVYEDGGNKKNRTMGGGGPRQ